jgi:hypothetical protein
MIKGSECIYRSGTTVHSKSPSVNSISPSPKKRKCNKENQDNDEPLIVSARNFVRIETFGAEYDNKSSPSHVMHNQSSYNTSPCKSYSTIVGP